MGDLLGHAVQLEIQKHHQLLALNDASVFSTYQDSMPTVGTTVPRLGELLDHAVHLEFQKHHQFPALNDVGVNFKYQDTMPSAGR
jgi:hypothetical protein